MTAYEQVFPKYADYLDIQLAPKGYDPKSFAVDNFHTVYVDYFLSKYLNQ